MKPGVAIVSNRLPVSVKKVDGKLEFSASAGGLATGLSSYATKRKNKWIGWPGIASDELTAEDKAAIEKELKKSNCYPVFLTENQINNYYNGYSNEVLWPALHELAVSYKPKPKYWRAYREVNKLFAEKTLELTSDGTTIWVHDYQLMLVPAQLRKERPKDRIGFFLHIPFPAAKNFFQLVRANKLLTGLLGSDLVGFHTPGYVQNFLDCCEQTDVGIVGPRKLILPDRVVRVADFPMGIDYGKFARTAKLAAVKRQVLKLRLKYRGKKIILTVDRLDPSKGLTQRVEAYREFLRQNPAKRGKVVMIMQVVPSRTDIPRYKSLKTRLEKLVAETNQEFGTARWRPIDYMFKSLPFKQLAALYQSADVAFIAPIKDGMNLVAKEYLASQPKNKGVLVLSQTAGAAGELKSAVMVNPRKTDSLVTGLSRALTRQRRFPLRAQKMRSLIERKDVHNWAGGFMKALKEDRPKGKMDSTRKLENGQEKALVEAYRSSQNRAIFLDYDGTLMPFFKISSEAKPTTRLKNLLESLAKPKPNTVFVISGRQKHELNDWLADIDKLGLVAEHGAYLRPPGDKHWHATTPSKPDWQAEAVKIMEKYQAKTPGSWVEIKSSGAVWHYRQAQAYTAKKALGQLKKTLSPVAKSHGLKVESGNKILEVRSKEVNKGSAAAAQMPTGCDFVLVIGDDVTDEDMFTHLPASAFTVKVGRGQTKAHNRLDNTESVIKLLTKLSKI